jgi:flagellar L-ring protein precursor FlgH
MKQTTQNKIASKIRLGLLSTTLLLGLSACGTMDRLSNVGKPPAMSPIVTAETQNSVKPVSLPMPNRVEETAAANSLWTSNRTTFFEDQRANEIGDILTVLIEIDEEAKLENDTERTRSTAESASLANLLGYENYLGKVFPNGVTPGSLANLGSDGNYAGSGEIDRKEEISIRVAAMVAQELPNGNFVIHGRQELLVNFEKRVVQIDGVIRPEDIATDNTINYDKVAQARIVYGGEGQITDVQQPRYGTQVYDIIFPF